MPPETLGGPIFIILEGYDDIHTKNHRITGDVDIETIVMCRKKEDVHG